MSIRSYTRAVLLLAAALTLSLAPGEKPVIIRLATLVPVGSPWYDVLEDVVSEWHEISANRVQVRLYPGGVAGDERDLITKMRIDHLQAAAMSATGVSEIDLGIWGLSLPMLLQEYNQLDWLRAQLADELEQRIERGGFIVLGWVDVGWMYWFSKDPIRRPEDLQKQRIFTWSTGPNVEGMWRSAGFHSVSIAATDVLPALQTGLVDAIAATPLTAATFQWFALANHMTPIKWSVMTGAIVITKRAWERIPAELRPRLLAATRRQLKGVKDELRNMDDKAVAVMKEHGLQIVSVTEEDRRVWRTLMDEHIHKLRGLLTDTTMYDMIMGLREQMPAPARSSP
ncbi:MAG: TRAP transporter substrate-binding protein DctP [Candidatus Neomarinimicrobiota bacterium]